MHLRSRGRIGKRKQWAPDMSITAETSQPVIEGNPCKRCGSVVKFAKRKGTCVRCHKQWRRDSEVKSTKYSNSLYRKLGITRESYLQMCEAQDWRCQICEKVPKVLVIDHCHATGAFRSLLCQQCNSGLGFFRDDPGMLQKALGYLQKC